MKNVKKLLFAVALVGAALVSAPKAALAGSTVCTQCAASGFLDCRSCCLCDGHTSIYCTMLCT